MLLFLELVFLLIHVSNGDLDYLHLRVINPSTLPFTYRLSPGQIGPHFNTTFTSTSLVLTEPLHACELVSNAHEVNRNIALIIRRGCSFVTKAINAHVAGAVAAIVYDFNRNAIQTFSMIQDDTSRRVQIPCAFMNGKDGDSITTALDSLNLTKAIVDFPVNVTAVPVYQLRLTPWTLW
ncbi:Protease-associated domain-containing protein isoform 2 [Schistosoma japonicum]|uniref:Protease-associated domain-containing protein isoform 2 n=1 Tax=Schistosoma japonicum TaxID=6182 RepID=A0A4Z2D2P9_SCHJA|nr:Protease-associated domain-containing protein isoform 2 [Schistosoma japonicum]